ncbi:MAG: SH3 domain-containing protein [Anaerolineae bacterium]|nr:SH3 domain-containing protein [Anaerolineae bacterium]
MQRAHIKITTALLVCLVALSSMWAAGAVYAVSTPVDSAALRQTGPYVTATGAVNVRGGPGTGFYIIGVLYSGEIVPILGISPDGTWWFVRAAAGDGWVSEVGVVATNADNVPVHDPGPIGTVTAAAVNVRSGAGPNAPVLGQLRQGQQVLIVGANADNTWVQIAWEYGTGWVSVQYLTGAGVPGAAPQNVPVTAAAPFGLVATALNVRAGPGINFAILGQVAGGEALPIVGRSTDNAWYQVQTVHGTGWVSAAYIIPRNEYGALPDAEGIAAGAAVTGPIGIINTGALNLRSGPGPQYTSLGALAGGEQGRIIGRNADWTWWLIQFPAGTGWVSGWYIIVRGDTSGMPFVEPGGIVPPAPGQGSGAAPAPAETGPIARVTTGALNIRSGPNSVFDSIGTVYAGTRMPIIGQSPDLGWWLVVSEFGNGWVTKFYIVVEGDASDVPVVVQ